jgi:hypothetical protein
VVQNPRRCSPNKFLLQLFESEMRCAIIEAETREEVMKEMEERMLSVEKMYARRLMNEVTHFPSFYLYNSRLNGLYTS